MIKSTFTVAVLAACAMAVPSDEKFLKWASSNGKQYRTVNELRLRRDNWAKSEAAIENLNASAAKANSKAKYGPNWTNDLSWEEYKEMLTIKEENIPEP